MQMEMELIDRKMVDKVKNEDVRKKCGVMISLEKLMYTMPESLFG